MRKKQWNYWKIPQCPKLKLRTLADFTTCHIWRKVLENELVVVDSLDMKEIKTSEMAKALNNLKVEGKALILLPEKNENVQKSARNIEDVKTTLVNTINVYDLLKYNKLVVTLDAVKKLEEVYA